MTLKYDIVHRNFYFVEVNIYITNFFDVRKRQERIKHAYGSFIDSQIWFEIRELYSERPAKMIWILLQVDQNVTSEMRKLW